MTTWKKIEGRVRVRVGKELHRLLCNAGKGYSAPLDEALAPWAWEFDGDQEAKLDEALVGFCTTAA